MKSEKINIFNWCLISGDVSEQGRQRQRLQAVISKPENVSAAFPTELSSKMLPEAVGI